MRFREFYESVGRIVKGVNTTPDVDLDGIKKQAAKFGNTVDQDGRPPTLSKKVKGKSTNVLYNLGLSETKKRKCSKNKKATQEDIVNEVPLPPDWDKEVYKGKGTFKDRIRYAVERAKKVGQGSSRVAFITEYEGRPTILKIAKNKKGLAQNNVEADILDDPYTQGLDITIPIIDYDEENQQPLWIHTEMAEKATEKTLCDIMKCQSLRDVVNLAKSVSGADPQMVPANKQRERIIAKSGISEQDYAILEEYATSIAELMVHFDLTPNDLLTPKNWGIYKGKAVIIDLGLTDTVWSTLYRK